MTIDRKRLVELFRAELEATHDAEAAVGAVARDAIASYQDQQEKAEAESRKAAARDRAKRKRAALASSGSLMCSDEAVQLVVLTKRILWEVASDFGLSAEVLFDRRHGHRRFAEPRWVAISMLRDLEMSMPKIARTVGLKDHTTVLYALREMDRRRKDLKERGQRLWEKLHAEVPTDHVENPKNDGETGSLNSSKEAA